MGISFVKTKRVASALACRADAIIDGDPVLVSSPDVPKPVAFRSAYSADPEGCNLYNRARLPASLFRTDIW